MMEASARILSVRSAIAEGDLQQNDTLQATLTLENGDIYRGTGQLVTPGNNVSTSTGTVTIRFTFDNPDHIILPGMSSETLFMKDLFDDLKISAEIEQFYEYKNAPNSYKQSDYTEPHREAMTELLSDIWSASLADIAEDRQRFKQRMIELCE